MNNHSNILAWHTSLSFQEHRKPWFYEEKFPVIALSGRMIPFQIVRAISGQSVASVHLVSLDDGSEVDLLSALTTAGLNVLITDNYEAITYPDTVPLSELNNMYGLHYLRVSDSSNTWYSEVLTFCEDANSLVQVEYWHQENFCFPGGEIVYVAPYKSKVYLKTEIGKPSYEYEEVVKRNNGYNFAIQQTTFKLHRFEVILHESAIDCLRLIGLHDDVIIKSRGREYVVDELLMNDPEWDDRADLATVEFEFKTDTVVNISGRNVSQSAYEPTPGTCVAILHQCKGTIVQGSDDYNNYRITLSDGTVYQFQDGDKVIIGNQVYVYSSSSYQVQSTPSQSVVFSEDDNIYYTGVGANVINQPGILFWSSQTEFIAGTFLPGATHEISYVTQNGDEEIVGNYDYSALANIGVQVQVPTEAVYLRMRLSSVACGIFFTALDYEIPPVSMVLYTEEYLNDANAVLGGVNDCDLYRISQGNEYGIGSPSGRTLILLPGAGCLVTYDNDADADSGGVSLGEVYAVSAGNDYGIISAGGRGLAVRTDGGSVAEFKGPFANDLEAASGGVFVFEAYVLSTGNDYGITSSGRALSVRLA